jgi:trehalose 6-phosphate synthase/phosphatase
MHAGIDMDSIKKITSSNEFNNYIEKYKRIIGDKKSFLSIDNTTELAQLKIKLDAYEKFLEKHEEYKGKSVLIQILKMNADFESKNLSYIEKYVSHIKEKFGEDSISFQKYDQKDNSINTKEEIALYTLC